MSADPRKLEAQKLSQPLEPAPMPEYVFQQPHEDDRPSFNPHAKGEDKEKLDLSGVAFNFK